MAFKLDARTRASLSEAASALQTFIEARTEWADERSERWQDSDRGQDFRCWLDRLTELQETIECADALGEA